MQCRLHRSLQRCLWPYYVCLTCPAKHCSTQHAHQNPTASDYCVCMHHQRIALMDSSAGQHPLICMVVCCDALCCCVLRPAVSCCALLCPAVSCCVVCQVWLPPHTAVFGCIYSFHRDPDYWPHALEFRPERWLTVRVRPHTVAL